MANNYTVSFALFKSGTVYTLTIGGGSGTAIPLKGAAKPFVTQEDDSDDMFTPIRTQSGYIRIVDDGFAADGVTALDWTDLIPDTDTSRPVTLRHTTNGVTYVDWQGFMQAQNFGSTLYGGTQVREFPVQCPLSVLSTTPDFKPVGADGIKNFAYILKTMFDKVTALGTTINAYRFCGNSARDWLMKMVDLQNFVTSNNDNGTAEARFDNKTIVADICQFWGWTCRFQGTTVYFTNAYESDNTKYLSLSDTQLGTLANGTSAGSYIDIPSLVVNLTNALCDAEIEQYYQEGHGKVLVTADANAAGNDILKFAPEVVELQMAAQGNYYNEQYGHGGNTYYSGDLQTFTTDFLTGSSTSGAGSFNIARNTDKTTADVIRMRRTYSGTVITQLNLQYQHAYEGNGYTRFGELAMGLRLRGTIWQNGFVFTDYNDISGVGRKSMLLRLGIGSDRSNAKWWTGAGWSSSPTTTKFWIGNQGDIIYSSYGPDTSHLTGSTEVIPLPVSETLHGKLFIDFYGSQDMPELSVPGAGNQRLFDIVNFAVEYEVGTAGETILGVPEQSSRKEYTDVANGMIKDEYGVDLIYASDNDMPRGYGVVMNSDYTNLTKLTYGSSQKFPEEYLASAMASYWAQSRMRLSLNVWNMDVTPLDKLSMAVGGTWHPASISHDWWNEKLSMVLLDV